MFLQQRARKKGRQTMSGSSKASSESSDGNEALNKRQFGIAAMKAKALFGNKLDFVVTQQKLSLGVEGKAYYRYSRICAANGDI